MADYCEFSDLPSNQCGHCRKVEPEEEKTPSSSVPTIQARYDGTCPSCREKVFEGDPLTLDDDGYWVCKECS